MRSVTITVSAVGERLTADQDGNLTRTEDELRYEHTVEDAGAFDTLLQNVSSEHELGQAIVNQHANARYSLRSVDVRLSDPAALSEWAKELAVGRDGNPYRLLASWQAIFGDSALAEATTYQAPEIDT